jgi:hypothetical protein
MNEIHLDPHAINHRGLEVLSEAEVDELDEEEREKVHGVDA